MAIKVSQAFERTSANPIDVTLALTKAQMKTVNDNLMPPYYFTVCQDDGYIYLYSKTNTADTTTGKFRKFEGGSGPSPSPSGSVYTGTLLANGWNASNQQTLTFSGYSADYHGVVGLPADATSAQVEAYRDAVIRTVSQSGATVTFECEEIPSIDLPVEIYCGGGSGSGGGAEAFTVTVTMDSGTGNLVADKTPKELEDAIAANAIIKANFPMYGLVLDSSVAAGGSFAFSTFYIEDQDDVSTSAFATILMVKDTDTTWSSIDFQTIQGNDFGKEPFEIHFANNAVDVTYSQLGEALSANRILKLIDTENNVVLAFTGYNSGAYYFSTICLNRRQEMVNTSIVLYQSAPSSDVVATQVQRLTMTEDVQKMEMPTADSSYLNKIYQYIGTTDANYTHGLFYTCVNNSGTYSWEQIDVQSYPEVNLNNVFASGMPSANMTGQQIHYSTNEQVIGTWIDGKPLYQKTVIMTMPTLSTKYAITPISDCDMLFVVWAFEYSSNSTMNVYTAYGNDTKLHGSVWTTNSHHADGGRIILQADDNAWAGVTVYVTVQYTKTTD